MRPSQAAALAAVAAPFAILCALRAPEPPALDQSLFVFYARCMQRGLHLYRDLWDSKPPGLFGLYAGVARFAAPESLPHWLDAAAAAGMGVLAFAHVRAAAGLLAACLAAVFASTLGSAPVFGGPLVAAQAEVLMAPLLLASLVAARRAGTALGFASGFLVGAAVLLKIVAVFLLPLAWLVSPPGERRRAQRLLAIVVGFATPLAACAVGLALQGDLAEALRAVLVYPRAYAAEVGSRTSLVSDLLRGTARLGTGLPSTLVLAACGAVLPGARALRVTALAWIVLASAAILVQRQMAGYQLFLLAPALALLAGRGAGAALHKLRRSFERARAGSGAAALGLAGAVALLAWPLALEARQWVVHYRPHVEHRTGRVPLAEFLIAVGGAGPEWLDAGRLTEPVRASGRDGDRLLVWGLAPAVYAQSGCLPATRYAFHQTFFVPGSPLSQRWPDAAARRDSLLAGLRRTPPRFVVVVRGDQSGLEPQDSEAELHAFPPLETWLHAHYVAVRTTRRGTLWVLAAGP